MASPDTSDVSSVIVAQSPYYLILPLDAKRQVESGRTTCTIPSQKRLTLSQCRHTSGVLLSLPLHLSRGVQTSPHFDRVGSDDGDRRPVASTGPGWSGVGVPLPPSLCRWLVDLTVPWAGAPSPRSKCHNFDSRPRRRTSDDSVS